MRAFFVTATGTDIGKTYVTARLLRHLRAQGENVDAIKPVASGFTMAGAAASDAGALLDALGSAVTPETVAALSPWRFEAPLSPDMAAAREGRAIEFEALVRFCRNRIASNDGVLFIEGVGGVMVPLDDTHTVRDWMAELDLPLLVVTGSYLGSISHTLTALEVLRHAGLKIAALVVNEQEGSTVVLEDTVAALARFVPGIAIVPLKRQAADAEIRRLWRTMTSEM